MECEIRFESAADEDMTITFVVVEEGEELVVVVPIVEEEGKGWQFLGSLTEKITSCGGLESPAM